MKEQIEKQAIKEMNVDVFNSVVWKDVDDGVAALDVDSTTENLHSKGYRKQSEGEWIVCGMFDDFFKCSICGDMHPWQTAIEYKFCPNCGAKMKGGAE